MVCPCSLQAHAQHIDSHHHHKKDKKKKEKKQKKEKKHKIKVKKDEVCNVTLKMWHVGIQPQSEAKLVRNKTKNQFTVMLCESSLFEASIWASQVESQETQAP